MGERALAECEEGSRGVGVARVQEGEACFVSAPLTRYPDPLSELSPADLLYPVFSQVWRGQFIDLCLGFPICEMDPGAHILL